MPEGRCGKSSGTLNEIKSVTKCYGGEVCRKKDGLLSFHKSYLKGWEKRLDIESRHISQIPYVDTSNNSLDLS